MRAHFFSSIAHELRTPLNSVIPILKLVIDIINKSESRSLDIPKILKLLQIVHNSSIHLENVINDALDISRLENNKFEINKSEFDIRDTINIVYDIMKFQIDAKKLQFKLNVKDSVPRTSRNANIIQRESDHGWQPIPCLLQASVSKGSQVSTSCSDGDQNIELPHPNCEGSCPLEALI